MKLPIKPTKLPAVHTANKKIIEIVGETGPVTMKLAEGKNTVELVIPKLLVVDNLSTPLNIGKCFLQQNDVKLAFDKNAYHLTLKNKTFLISQLLMNTEPCIQGMDEVQLIKMTPATTSIPPNSVKLVHCTVDPGQRGNKIEALATQARFIKNIIIPEGIFPVHNNKLEMYFINPSDKTIQLSPSHRFTGSTVEPIELPGINNMGMDEKSEEAADYKELTVKELAKLLRIEENQVLRDNPKIKKKLLQLLKKHIQVFNNSRTPGCTDLIECKLKLKDKSVEPVRCKARFLHPALAKDLDTQIKQMIKDEIIEPSESPWASPLVCVRKKNGQLRWCVDYRLLNDLCEKNAHPLPNITQMLENAAGKKIYSCLDAISAYYSVKMAEDSKPLTAFISPKGLFNFCRMPFGLQAAPGIYSRLVALVAQGLPPDQVSSYLDDTLIHSITLQEHLKCLDETFSAYTKAGIRLNPEKTNLFQEQCKYLGFIISKKGIMMDDQYVSSILQWPRPMKGKDVQRFLGFTCYYSRFIPNYSQRTNLLNQQRNTEDLEWNDELEAEFTKLKQLFAEKPIRHPPDYGPAASKFIITTDYSRIGFGATLSQKQNGKEVFLAASSRTTTTAEKNYSSIKGELAALVFAVRKFSQILGYSEFIARTDSSYLCHLKTIKPTNALMVRWLEYLQGFNFTVEHIKGAANQAADALSRTLNHAPPDAVEKTEQDEFNRAIFALEAPNAEEPINTPLSPTYIREQQERDPVLITVSLWLESQPDKKDVTKARKDLQVYYNILNTLQKRTDGVLIQQVKHWKGDLQKILVPEALRQDVFLSCHNDVVGHWGIIPTASRISLRFFYPGILQDVRNRVNTCNTCLQKTNKINVKQGTHYPHQYGYPNQMLFVDLIGPMPVTERQHKYCLTLMDGFSRYAAIVPLVNKTAATVVEGIITSWINYFGPPARIHSDQGLEFTSKITQALLQRLGIKTLQGPAYNPHSNPIERMHRTLNGLIRTILPREERQWDKYITLLMFAYNTRLCAATGVTPAASFLSRELSLPIDLIIKSPEQTPTSPLEEVQNMERRYNHIYKFVLDKQKQTIRRNGELYGNEDHKFKEGDKVWFFTSRNVKDKSPKLTRMWIGPFKVTKLVNKVLVTIVDRNNKANTVHISRLKPVQGHVPKGNIPAQWEDEDDLDPLVEEIQGPAVYNIPQDNITTEYPTDETIPEIVDIVTTVPAPSVPTVPASIPSTAAPSRGQQVASKPILLPSEQTKRKVMEDRPAASEERKRPHTRGLIRLREEEKVQEPLAPRKKAALTFDDYTEALEEDSD